MSDYFVTFFGHRDIYNFKEVEKQLYEIICRILQIHPFVVFYIGRNGDFDVHAASVLKRARKDMENEDNEIICVLPYNISDIEYYEKYYDEVFIPECIEKTHPKGAITKRNKWMVEQADLVICYVERNKGGAYAAMKYARSLGKKTINLAEKENE